ncbi:thymidine kinase [Paracrocinitomix mangrovi]|nr:thymidine kinase [Paracrocinitomix mangrovi]
MFSGKTTALISQVQQLRNEGKDVFVFKPQLDNRYADKSVVSHDKNKVEAFAIDKSVQILDYHLNADVVAVDEVQFFDDKIVEVLQKVANDGKDVIAAGLDMDYLGRPFGAIPALLTVADDVKKLNSVCTFCSGKARFSHRISQDNGTVVLGEKDKYVPLCRSCYNELKDQ